MDIYICLFDIYFIVNNDEKGIKEVVRIIKKYLFECSVIEVIGCFEMFFILVCVSVNLFFVIVNFIYVKCFVGVLG